VKVEEEEVVEVELGVALVILKEVLLLLVQRALIS
jgi:hypothetical protein